MILETQKGSDPADTISLVMLNTAGQSTVNIATKEDVPEVEKKIIENGVESDYIDAAIGDTISFEIIGSVSDKYADYESYYYEFSDTLSAGLTLNDDIKIYVNDVNGQEITTSFSISKIGNSFTATTNLKEIAGVNIDENSKVVVRYTASLNENASSASDGNTNTVILKYENDPYRAADGDSNPLTPNAPTPGDEGTTPEDINVVFTFDVIVNKKDGSGVDLAGAGFTLYKQDEEGNWPEEGEGTVLAGGPKFSFEGLDEGIYKLVETTVPDGYNKADDIIFKIVPTYTDNPSIALTGLEIKNEEGTSVNDEFNVDIPTGTATVNIANLTGSLLPSTGGIGTTIFYIVGGALVLFAVVLLVTKKRMKDNQ